MTDSPVPESPANPEPAAPAAAAAPRGGPPLEEQLAAAKAEAAANYDRFLRAAADLENYRRRVTREKDELRHTAALGLLQHLLPVLDNLQLAVAAARPDAAAGKIAEGVALVQEQFRGVLERHGLKELNPVGLKFNPHQHESLSHQPSPTVPEEHVLQVVRVGYTLHGKLVRPASVVLSSGPAKEATG